LFYFILLGLFDICFIVFNVSLNKKQKERMMVQVMSQQQQVLAVVANQQAVVSRAAVAQTALAVWRV